MTPLAAAACAAGLALALDAAPADPVPPTLERADAEVLERVYEESHAARRPPRTGWPGYLAHLANKIGSALARLLAGGLEAVAGQALLWAWVARLLVVAAALALLVAAARLVVALARRGRAAAESPAPVAGGPAAAPAWDAAAWRTELDRRLTRGEVAAALEAAWWWLARALLGERADPSWTGRELLARAGRGDLLPLVRRLDVLAYGAARPAAEEVRQLALRLAEVLA